MLAGADELRRDGAREHCDVLVDAHRRSVRDRACVRGQTQEKTYPEAFRNYLVRVERCWGCGSGRAGRLEYGEYVRVLLGTALEHLPPDGRM